MVYSVELTFLGGASEVGASCTLLQVAGRTFLIDGGMRPAVREGQPRIPDLAMLDPHPPEALLITHAHIDPRALCCINGHVWIERSDQRQRSRMVNVGMGNKQCLWRMRTE